MKRHDPTCKKLLENGGICTCALIRKSGGKTPEWQRNRNPKRDPPKPTTGLPLFAVGAPYVVGSDTSEDAARSIAPHVNEMQRKCLAFVRSMEAYGATQWETAEALGLLHQTCSARFVELRERGFIVDSGRRRPTATGRYAVVYVAAKEDTP